MGREGGEAEHQEGEVQALQVARLRDASVCSEAFEMFRGIKGSGSTPKSKGGARVELRGPWASFKSCTRGGSWNHLKGLSLAGCGLGDGDIRALSRALPPALSAFGISSNPGIPTNTWRVLWKALRETLTEVDCGLNGLEADALPAFCEDFLVPNGTWLKELCFEGNSFQSLAPLGLALRSLPRLAVLDLSNNKIDDDGFQPFIEALPGSALQCLKLNGNARICRTAAMLFRILPRVPSLEALHLNETALGDDGLETLWPYLSDCSLHDLRFRNTWVTDAGLRALIAGIPGSPLQTVEFEGNEISEEISEALTKALSSEFKDRQTEALQSHRNKVDSARALAATTAVHPSAKQARDNLKHVNHGRFPVHQQTARHLLAEEVEYVSSLAVLGAYSAPKTRLVRLLTEVEKTDFDSGLKSKLQSVKCKYERDLALKPGNAWRERVKELYGPQVKQVEKSIAQLCTEYIFIDCDVCDEYDDCDFP